MSFEFTMALLTLAMMAAIGAPIAFGMVVSAIFYLLLSGQDLSIGWNLLAHRPSEETSKHYRVSLCCHIERIVFHKN